MTTNSQGEAKQWKAIGKKVFDDHRNLMCEMPTPEMAEAIVERVNHYSDLLIEIGRLQEENERLQQHVSHCQRYHQ